MRTLPTLVLLLVAGLASAASPKLSAIVPRGGQRGTEVELTFTGDRLADAEEIIPYGPGIAFGKLTAGKENAIKVQATLAKDCPLGEHGFRVRTKSGISELKTFWVGALPCIDEKEPNTEFGQAQKIPLNVTVHGTIEIEDVDCFAVECKRGQRLSAEVEGMRLGGGFFDPYLAILNSKRFEIATSDDHPLLGQDSAVSLIVPEDGTYVVQVRDSAYAGTGAARYRLHVGTFPRPTGVMPLGGKPGDTVEVRFLGDPKGEQKRTVKLPTMAGEGKFGLYLEDEGGVSPSPVPFHLSALPNYFETEPNGDMKSASPAGDAPCALNGIVDKPGDADYWKFRAKKGQTLDVTVYARRLGSPLDSVLTVTKPNGSPLGFNDDADKGADSYLRVQIPEDGDYTVIIHDHLKKGGPGFFYRVEITVPESALALSIPSFDLNASASQTRQAIAVPRGNRYATPLLVNRNGIGGDLKLIAEGLPAGVRMEAVDAENGLSTVPVVFEADADASLAGALIDVRAKAADGTIVAGGMRQKSDLINGQQGAIFAAFRGNKLALAVTESAPFAVKIVPPKAPLVRNGSMGLKVVAERFGDYKGAITLTPLYNPTGIGSAVQTIIAEGQTEAYVPINANGGAPTRSWQFAVWGKGETNRGTVWVASPLASIEVAPPFVTMNFERSSCEQGKALTITGKVSVQRPFTGTAKVNLLGLPSNVTAPGVTITKDSTEVQFPLTVAANAPAGQHKNILCSVVVEQNGEAVTGTAGTLELRIDAPLAAKKQAAQK